ncbi:hypothetical protein KEM54_003084 [Ascosphaera aggregata]|nr:hypothetical protein KEM54_003084 [Ascosphaera aggregata]
MTAPSEPSRSSTDPVWLTQVSEKKLSKRCKPGGFTYCPSMNLIAVTSVDEQVNVYRLNGQHVLGGAYGTPKIGPVDNDEDDDNYDNDDGGETREVKAIAWKPDGKYLAVVCSDNTLRIISTTSAKTVHHLACGPVAGSGEESTNSVPSCLGWTTNFTDEAGSLDVLRDSSGDVTLESLLSCEAKISDLRQLKGDLPRELMLLDIEASLPKLSTLPSTHDDQDVFSSRSSIDSIFHGKKELGDTVDVLLVAHTDGTIDLKIYNCFDIGAVNVKDSLKPSMQAVPIAHASHPLTSTRSLLYHLPENNQLRLVVSDLNFITVSGRYLSLLASKITQLQNLLRYIKQVQTQIQLEWKNTQELTGRFLRSVNMDLDDKLGCDFITAAYHLVVTGDCWEPLRDFLVDTLGDRGHKRWDKTVSTGYESIRKYTHDCLLPALERASIHLNTLIGLSKFHKLSATLGLWTDNLQACQETIDVLTILSHKVMIHSSNELRGFTAFSKWLKLQIDLQVAEPLSQTSQDLMEKSDSIDYSSTLKYLLGPLRKSCLRSYLQPAGQTALGSQRWDIRTEANGTFYEKYKQALSNHEKQLQEKGESDTSLPFLNDLTSRLSSQFDVVMRQIADAQRKKFYHRCPLEVPADCDSAVSDMIMNYEILGGTPVPSVYIATRLRSSPDTFHLYRVMLATKDGKNITKSVSLASTSFGSGTILTFKLLDDGTILLLWRDDTDRKSTHLMQLSYIDNGAQGYTLTFRSLSTGKTRDIGPTAWPPLTAEGGHAEFVRHTFASDQGFEAAKLEVSRYEGRQVICILSADCRCYRIFDTVSKKGGKCE